MNHIRTWHASLLAPTVGDSPLSVQSRARTANEHERESRTNAKQFRETTDKRVKELKSIGSASIVIGILSLVFLAMTTLTIRSRGVGFTAINLNGYDLASGTIPTAHHYDSLGGAYPVLWLVILGSVLAILFGVVALLPSIGSKANMGKSSVRNASKLIAAAGIMILFGAVIVIAQLFTASAVGLYPGDAYMFQTGWPPLAEVGLGILLIVTAAKP